MAQSRDIELSQDAAVVAALAGTAMSFSHSAEDQAERWLRALRLHGSVGSALQALGVGEAPLETAGDQAPPAETPPLADEAVGRVIRKARDHAGVRAAEVVCTTDLLFALLDVYGGLMDRALQERGASREELILRLAANGTPVEA